jgi:hypothetical protein
MPDRPSRFRQSCLLSLLLVAACQTSVVHRNEMPEQPIAFIYYPEEIARRRADRLNHEPVAPQSNLQEKRGVVDLNAIGKFLGDSQGPGTDTREFAGRIALLDPVTGDVEVLAAATKGAIPLAWSSDHRRLLFTQDTSGGMQLFEFDRRLGVVLKITRGPNLHPWGCYGPDSRVVLMVAEVGFDTEREVSTVESRIGVLAPGGLVEFVSDGPYDRDPTCSPDGTAIAYVRSNEAGLDQVWVRSLLAEGEARPISPGYNPSFSPDGEWIVYNQRSRGSPRLWRIHKSGSGRRLIGEWSGTEEIRPRVSPDGAIVVYESVLDNRFRLFVRRMDGTGNRVLFSDGDGSHAVW